MERCAQNNAYTLKKKVVSVAIYTYDDTFIVDSVDPIELDNTEAKAIEEVDKIGITDEFYKEKAVVSKVYATLATLQLENNGMSEKRKAYESEFRHYVSLAKNNSSTTNVSTIPVIRG